MMDLYGCSTSWQVNRENELPNTYTGWPTAAGAGGAACERAPTDPHVMPPPSCSPWTPAGLSWGSSTPPQLVHFTAHTPPVPHNTVLHCKRKGDMEPVIPAKQLITEEKMAAHLSGLHISGEYREHGDEPAPRVEWPRSPRTVVLADEIKRLRQEPLLPPSLLQRLEKPCTSLMVWQPREATVPRDDDDDDEELEEGKRRGGVLVAEHAPIDTDVEM